MNPPLEPAGDVFQIIHDKATGIDPEIVDLADDSLYQSAGTKVYAMTSILNVPMEYVRRTIIMFILIFICLFEEDSLVTWYTHNFG